MCEFGIGEINEDDQKLTRKVPLNDTIKVFPDNPISRRSRVYPGEYGITMDSTKGVAIKIVPHSKYKEREAANLLLLRDHTNVVHFIGYGIIYDSIVKTIFIAMEECQNISLQSYYHKRKEKNLPFNPKQALEFSRQLVGGLNYIHDSDIIHRDLKPGSILFSMDGKNLKIVGFGMSKRLEQGITEMSLSTEHIGTDGYRAPETYQTGNITKSSDVFSLGIILYHVWTYGSHPFGEDPDIWSYNIKHGKIVEGDEFTKRLLIPDPKNRARDLLLHMLKNEHIERLVITQVMDHEYISQGANSILLKSVSCDNWQGNVEGVKGMGDLSTEKYSIRMASNESYEFDSVGQISVVRAVSLNSLLSSIDGQPSGYLSLSVDARQNLLKALSYELYQMAWLSLFHNKILCKAFVIIRPPGYEELIALRIDSPTSFVSKYKKQVRPDEPSLLLLELTDYQKGLDFTEQNPSSQRSSSHATTSTADSISEFKRLLGRSSGDTGLIPWWIPRDY